MKSSKKVSVTLWIVQALLAALFLFAGATKFTIPAEVLAEHSPLPVWFLQFIGLAEVLGALGLVLPGVTRIAPVLTPLAAAGLVVIMIGATILSVSAGGPAAATVPAITGALALAIGYGRVRVPHASRRVTSLA